MLSWRTNGCGPCIGEPVLPGDLPMSINDACGIPKRAGVGPDLALVEGMLTTSALRAQAR